MKYLSQKDFKRLQELIETVIAAHAQARDTQENKKCVSGFDCEAFLGEKELYSDHIIGCTSSATHYQERRITAETAAKIADCIIHQCDIEKYPQIDRFLHNENLQKNFPCALKELQKLAEIKNILLKISNDITEKSIPEQKQMKTAKKHLIFSMLLLALAVAITAWFCSRTRDGEPLLCLTVLSVIGVIHCLIDSKLQKSLFNLEMFVIYLIAIVFGFSQSRLDEIGGMLYLIAPVFLTAICIVSGVVKWIYRLKKRS